MTYVKLAAWEYVIDKCMVRMDKIQNRYQSGEKFKPETVSKRDSVYNEKAFKVAIRQLEPMSKQIEVHTRFTLRTVRERPGDRSRVSVEVVQIVC